jgi:hypothetical protein
MGGVEQLVNHNLELSFAAESLADLDLSTFVITTAVVRGW